jgi:hypothetical protein
MFGLKNYPKHQYLAMAIVCQQGDCRMVAMNGSLAQALMRVKPPFKIGIRATTLIASKQKVC